MDFSSGTGRGRGRRRARGLQREVPQRWVQPFTTSGLRRAQGFVIEGIAVQLGNIRLQEIVQSRLNNMAAVPGPSASAGLPEAPNDVTETEEIIVKAQVLKLLECPVCYDTILRPILLCQNGHSVCNSCKKDLQFCPICKAPFTPVRNLLAEEIVSRCRIACKNKDSGCEVVLLGGLLSAHHSICEFG